MGILRTDTVSGIETPTPVTGSVVFDGSGDYLTIAASNDFFPDTYDFTIEWFQYWNSLSGFQDLLDINYTAGLLIETGSGNGRYNVYADANTIITSEPTSPETGKWYHYALVGDRSAGTMTLYRNGVLSNSGSWATNINVGSASHTLSIGCRANGTNPVNGYVSNFRFLKGTALYTSNFTPPTHELEVIGDTVLLCCNNPESAGAEATGKAITVNGNATASTFSPGLVRDFTYGTQFDGVSRFDTQGYFVPPSGNTQNRYTLGLDEIVTDGLVLHLDAGNPFSYPVTGVGTHWNDLSGNNNHGVLYNGVSYTENNRGALVFDGVDDGVIVNLPLSSSTFTYNAWVYSTNNSDYRCIIDRDDDRWSLFAYNGQIITFNPSVNSGYFINLNQWYNVSITHIDGQPIYFYINGYLVYTSSNVLNNYTTSYVGVGCGTVDGVTPNEVWSGRISTSMLYNKALTAQEVLQNYEALKGRYGHS